VDEKIGILDSGVGGVSVFREMKRLLPNAHYIYFSDSKNNPYGDKTVEEIREIVFQNVEFLVQKNCKMIVLACNTATAVAIDALREKYPDICFVGTEPAIKVIHDANVSGKALLLATQLTLNCERVQELIHKYSVDNLTVYPCVGLADLIEAKKLEEVELYIQKHLLQFSDASVIVLGCTHYPLVLDIFKKYFPTTRFVDGSLGIARQVVRKVKELSLPRSSYQLEFIDSSNTELKKPIFEFYCSRDF